ncbi:hypothetical protein U14_01850 [Candidatus Moduliflexus flocculans]|uniref:Uncharacterized protein n=1 Tax=Candidatus Moduliflexus flocculans TaxID=1499966 RepID=A0A0S6VXP6_9BACT|nr:hypothetical protein U14_01850 [Candidatus Moduliflexus flocculans]
MSPIMILTATPAFLPAMKNRKFSFNVQSLLEARKILAKPTFFLDKAFPSLISAELLPKALRKHIKEGRI